MMYVYITRSASSDSRNYFALIKRRDAIRPQPARREIRWLSLAVQAFPAELSSRNTIFHYMQRSFFAFDCSGRKIISPSLRRTLLYRVESSSTLILRNKLTV